MDNIRLATVEEVDPIASKLDITPLSTVVTFGGQDFAVIRQSTELDPVVFAKETSNRRKLFFLTNLETALRLQGVKEIYFNADASNTEYLDVLKHLGAEPVTDRPVIRFKKVL